MSDDDSFFHYLPISDELFHDGFYLTSAGQVAIAPGQSYPPKGHPSLYDFNWREGRVLPEFSILIVASGSGEFQQDGLPLQALPAGSILCVFPGLWHRYRPKTATGWTEKWIQFNGEFAHKLQERGLLSPSRPVLQPENFPAIDEEFSRLLNSIHENPSANSLLRSIQALSLISRLFRPDAGTVSHPTGPTSEDPVVAAALSYIWTNNHRTISVSEVADQVQLNRRSLERKFSKVLSQSVLEQIIQCRFNRAERLLKETDLSIKTIVSLSGFGSEETMRKTFVQRVGQSPRSYRNRS
jgi:AraC-like DNA-binding protein